MANGEQPRERVAVHSAPRAGAAPPRAARAPSFWRTLLLILLAFLLLGAVPILLLGQLEGVWWVHLPGSPDYHHATATPARGYTDNLPRQAWIAITTQIFAQPGQTAAIAMLEPGFPVVVTAHTSVHGALWSHVVWQGPSATTGANGWTLDNSMVGFGGGARPIGDLGALSPALGKWAAPYSAQLSAVLYFVDSGQLYHLNPTHPFALDAGFSSALLADLYASGEARKSPPTSAEVSALAVRSPLSDGLVLPSIYHQLGGASGVSTFLSQAAITGIAPAESWTGAQATPSGMIQLYAALETDSLLTRDDDSALRTALQQANAGATATLLGGHSLPSGGYLVRAEARTSAGWVASACGVLRLPIGRLVMAVAVRSPASQQASDATLTGFFAQVMAVAS